MHRDDRPVLVMPSMPISGVTGLPRSITCMAAAVRDGEQEPCGKPAVGWIRHSRDEWGDIIDHQPWPACAWHLNRYTSEALPLDEIAVTAKQYAVKEVGA